MPEFILDSEGAMDGVEFSDLSPFAQGYIQAMFFTDTSCIPMTEWHTEESRHLVSEGQADGSLPTDAGFSDLHPDTLAGIHSDCSDFQQANRALLSQAYALEPGSAAYRYGKEHLDPRRAGQLFWYARCGHGVSFVDDGDAPCLHALQEAARKVGNVDAWFSEEPDDESPTGYGWVYLE